jgi:toxin ParE1/3/4
VKHAIRPAARDDILRQFRYYLREDAFDAATRFLDAVDESIEAICQMPHIGAPKQSKNPVLAGLRSWPVKGFEDLLIFYLVQPDALRVVRILHGKRDIQRILECEKNDESHH